MTSLSGAALAGTTFDLAAHIRALRACIDEALARAIAADRTGPLYASMRYSLLSGGKRLRPILCLTCVDLLGGSLNAAMPTACGLEMLHTATLIHDDLPAMDDDDLRHGKPANHKVFGEGMALLAGDALLAYCLEFILENTRGVDDRRLLRVVETIVRAVGAHGLTGGQAIDLELQGRDDVDVAVLELMHSRKTAALIQASVATGATIAGADDEVLPRLVSYAGKVGLAYQIVDDVLDETGTSEMLGMLVSPSLAVFALLLVELSNVLPTAPGQLGSFDAAVLTAAAGFVPGEQALAFALLFHAQQILPQAVAGAVVSVIAIAGGRDTRRQGATRRGP